MDEIGAIDLVNARFFKMNKHFMPRADDLIDGDIVMLEGVGVFKVKLVHLGSPCQDCDCKNIRWPTCENGHFTCRLGDYSRQLKRVGDGTN